ncbi:hypothetical protein DB345_02355 [Spartobacteria bacterium LR76]|nr:hypothetical protein DB345_02355 [Spartobacteria bacterium LR76]
METPIDLHEALAPVAFKYCDDRGVDILRNLRLKVTPPLYFNDPFEFTPYVFCSSPSRKIKAILRDKENQREVFKQEKRRGFSGTMRDFRRIWRKSRAELISKGICAVPQANRDLQERALKAYSERHGVLCLSGRADSLLMWGHYSCSQKGLVFGLASDWEFFREPTKGLREIQYVRERPEWDSVAPLKGEQGLRIFEKIIFSKNDDWAYEREFRQLFELKCLQKESGKTEECYYLPIPAAVVKCVILGLRTPAELENEVRAILSDEKFAHVSLWKAGLHESRFALNFRCIKQGRSPSEL